MIKKFPRKFTKLQRVDFLQRMIIVNSFIYYEMNTNKLTDKDYDELTKQYLEEVKGVDISDTMYYQAFSDFDGNTGFDLYTRLDDRQQNIIKSIAYSINTNKVRKEKKGKLF